MAIKIGSNFTFQGKQPNFERDRFATKAAMKAFPETSIDDGHLSYCVEDGNTYQFKSSNSVDDVTGKWRVFKADVDLSAYATKDSVVADLTKKVDIIGVYQSGSATNKYYSILTIDFPKTNYETVCLDGNIICRHFHSDIMIAFEGNSPTKVILRAYNTLLTIKYSNDISFYYLIDNEGKKVNIYVETSFFDQFNFKIVNSNSLDYLININVIDAIPEGAVKISNIGYDIKNLFYATPKDNAGNPTFRAIDVADLPDLSSKYATKEKAFTKDTASTEPGQVVAGPATTQGNLYLRKLIADDIPDLKSKYQAINSNGYQPNPLMINARVGADSNSGYKYLTALTYGLPDNIPYKASPDWYFATDGTLQDIKTKIPKVVLDDAVSTTSDNGVKNSVITQYVDSKVTVINDSIADVRTSLDSTQTDFVYLRNKVNAMPKTVFITQAAYNALTTKDANTIYYING